MLDLMRLQTFVYAAETLNFSSAAQQMQLSQPTISHHIKALEESLGMELFDRSAGALKLTEAGRLLLPQARKLVRQSYEIEQMVASVREQIVGHIRIACSTTAGKYVLPQFAARFRMRHPGVRVSILSCTSANVVPRLLDAEANIGVVSFDVCGRSGLECQVFFEDHIVLMVPAHHRWAGRASIDPSELLEEPFLLREETSGTRRVLLAELGKHDIALDDMNVFLELGNAEAIVRMVEAGFGVSFVSRLSGVWALERKSVIEVPVTGFDLRRQMYMAQKTIHAANRGAEAFWGFVHDASNADLMRMAER